MAGVTLLKALRRAMPQSKVAEKRVLAEMPWYRATSNPEPYPRGPRPGAEGMDRLGTWYEMEGRGTGNAVYDALSDPESKYGLPRGYEHYMEAGFDAPMVVDDYAGKEPWDKLEAMMREAGGPEELIRSLRAQDYDSVVLQNTRADTDTPRTWAIVLDPSKAGPYRGPKIKLED